MVRTGRVQRKRRIDVRSVDAFRVRRKQRRPLEKPAKVRQVARQVQPRDPVTGRIGHLRLGRVAQDGALARMARESGPRSALRSFRGGRVIGITCKA